MQSVDLTHRRFAFGGDPRFRGAPLEEPPKIFECPAAIELLRHIADDDSQQRTGVIEGRSFGQGVAEAVYPNRSSTHFKSYRRNPNYFGYHDAAVAISAGHATAAQKDLVLGLDREITACCVVVPAGQMLFHGRGDRELDELAPCPSFGSTPLDPTVSIYHAIKRQQQRTGARTILYALTLESPLPALWGNSGSLEEWELLCSPD